MRVKRHVVFSDMHLKGEGPSKFLVAATTLLAAIGPVDTLVVAGDAIDLGMLSRYDQHPDDPWSAAAQLDDYAAWHKAVLPHARRHVALPGNHEARWAKALGLTGPKWRAVQGLDFHSTLRRHGLPKRVEWVEEGVGKPGLWLGPRSNPFLVRHGDLQSSRYSAAPNLAARMLQQQPRYSEIHGHHHKIRLAAATSLGRTVWKVTNGHLGPDEFYANGGDAPWERGFTIVHEWGQHTFPQLVMVAPDGTFAYDGHVWGPQGRLT